jgi:hypothetical protein
MGENNTVIPASEPESTEHEGVRNEENMKVRRTRG